MEFGGLKDLKDFKILRFRIFDDKIIENFIKWFFIVKWFNDRFYYL